MKWIKNDVNEIFFLQKRRFFLLERLFGEEEKGARYTHCPQQVPIIGGKGGGGKLMSALNLFWFQVVVVLLRPLKFDSKGNLEGNFFMLDSVFVM